MKVATIDLATYIMFDFRDRNVPLEMKFDFVNDGMDLYTEKEYVDLAKEYAGKIVNRFNPYA